MAAVSKEILLMVYKGVIEKDLGNVVTYWCTDEYENSSRYETLIFVNKATGNLVQYDEIVKYCTCGNIGFIELKHKAIVFNLETLEEIKSYPKCMGCKYIYEEAVAIPMKDRLVVYSLRKNIETFNEECECSGKLSFGAHGRIYDYIDFNTAAIIVKRDGTVGKLFKASNGKALHCISDKRTYCDLIVGEIPMNSYMGTEDDWDYKFFVCNSNVYTLKEYLEFLTIESITESNRKSKLETTNRSFMKYNVILRNGQKGQMSSDFTRMRLDKDTRNILDTNFEFYKKQYLE